MHIKFGFHKKNPRDSREIIDKSKEIYDVHTLPQTPILILSVGEREKGILLLSLDFEQRYRDSRGSIQSQTK